jgi:hypothetical protein
VIVRSAADAALPSSKPDRRHSTAFRSASTATISCSAARPVQSVPLDRSVPLIRAVPIRTGASRPVRSSVEFTARGRMCGRPKSSVALMVHRSHRLILCPGNRWQHVLPIAWRSGSLRDRRAQVATGFFADTGPGMVRADPVRRRALHPNTVVRLASAG